MNVTMHFGNFAKDRCDLGYEVGLQRPQSIPTISIRMKQFRSGDSHTSNDRAE